MVNKLLRLAGANCGSTLQLAIHHANNSTFQYLNIISRYFK